MSKTAAEQQIELLKKMKESPVRRKAPGGEPGPDGEASGPAAAAAKQPSLPLARAAWRRLALRQRATREFKSKREMGDWAAELILALPTAAHRMDAAAREELFGAMRAFCAARGLK